VTPGLTLPIEAHAKNYGGSLICALTSLCYAVDQRELATPEELRDLSALLMDALRLIHAEMRRRQAIGVQ
jgi:hypothetical protein